jgi:hypothetical protein
MTNLNLTDWANAIDAQIQFADGIHAAAESLLRDNAAEASRQRAVAGIVTLLAEHIRLLENVSGEIRHEARGGNQEAA